MGNLLGSNIFKGASFSSFFADLSSDDSTFIFLVAAFVFGSFSLGAVLLN